jgi:hypothetical protein
VEPQPKAKTNGHDKSKTLDDYPEAPWAYEQPKRAAQMAYDYAKAQGTDITSPEGYKRGAIRRMDSISDAFGKLASETPKSDLSAIETARDKMLALRSSNDAQGFRAVLKGHFPHIADAIDTHLSDDWIKKTWTPKRSTLH